jgi:hypothetical protein
MILWSILHQQNSYSSCLVTAFQFGSKNVFAYYLPVWFHKILGVDPIKSGAYFMAFAGTFITAPFVIGVVGIYHFRFTLLRYTNISQCLYECSHLFIFQ